MNNRTVENQTFVGANVQVDGDIAYINCRFVKCKLVFLGTGSVRFQGSTLENCEYAFAGPAANTLSYLKHMYASGMQQMVETVFQEIRGTRTPVVSQTPQAKVQ